MKHELNIWPKYFKAIASGSKTFEIRKDDRGFEVDDTLILRESEPIKFKPSSMDGMGQDELDRITAAGYSGSEIEVLVDRIWRECPGVKEGYVVLGIIVREVRYA